VTEHPYKQAPDRAFWSRSVSRDFDASSVADAPPFLLTRDDRFMSAGSCFASNVRSYLEGAGYRYTVTEAAHPLWSEWVEEAYYEAFSARYGNIYTARQMVQLLERGLGSFQPAEEYWQSDGTLIDPFRPGLRYRARSVGEFRALTRQHLRAVLRAVEISSVFVFTLGLTEAWVSTDDEAVFPACPGTVAGAFDERRHKFRNFSVEEVTRDLVRMVSLARSVNGQSVAESDHHGVAGTAGRDRLGAARPRRDHIQQVGAARRGRSGEPDAPGCRLFPGLRARDRAAVGRTGIRG